MPNTPGGQPEGQRPDAPPPSQDPAELAARLDACRQRIDALDAQLIKLLSERGSVAAEIGRIKSADGTPIYASDRESLILQKLRRQNPGPFPDRVLEAIYRELMSGSFLLERPLRIAYLGPRGSFTHQAATTKFGAAVDYEPVTDIAAIFDEVARERVDFGVVPVENSTGGGIVDTLDAFAQTNVKVCAELLLPIQHHLLGRGPFEQIDKVYSKPEIFEQCKQWLLETGLANKTIAAASSSRAAELAASEQHAAAIGSSLAAELYGLPVLREQVQDDAANVTRFFVLGRQTPKPTGNDGTALVFATMDRAGALVDVLDVFRSEDVNLTMITSRPSRRKHWEYLFFVTAEGHRDDDNVARALTAVREMCAFFHELGSFPRAAG